MNLVIGTIEQKYWNLLTHSQLSPDPAQVKTVQHLQQCLNALDSRQQTISKKFKLLSTPPPTVLGVYIWGPVGRGKTMLMDLFCQCLAPQKHLRLHFHRFMSMIHQQLFIHSGKPDPLTHIANELSAKYTVICFDEFFVSDIGDAMILGRMYYALFSNGVTIISTSNTEPDSLYADGLHRDRFIPAIEMIKSNMHIITLDNGTDHRFRQLKAKQAYFIKNDPILASIYSDLAPDQPEIKSATIHVCKREINCIAKSKNVIWFDFIALCEGPRSAQDYIELASRFAHVIVSHVPCFSGSTKEQIKARGTEDSNDIFNTTGLRQIRQSNSDDRARRFISLVDELYDCKVNLYLSAESNIDQLYNGELLKEPFKRTLSRLHEMSSVLYQATPSISEREDYSASLLPMSTLGHDLE